MDKLTDINVFVRVVDNGSFTRTAAQLRLSRAAISKYVSRLEARRGARLLNRTTRHLSLTEAGATLYEASRGALAQIEQAELAIGHLQMAPRGRLKVNVPMSFGILHVAPAMAEFLAAYPEVTVDMTMEDRVVDLVDEGFDMAVRIGNLADSSAIARRLAPSRMVVCASPAYLARHGTPKTPDDLARHNCIVYSYASTPDVWRLTGPDGEDTPYPCVVISASTTDLPSARRR